MKAFKPGDIINWSNSFYLVLKGGSQSGTVVECCANGSVIEDFAWNFAGYSAQLVFSPKIKKDDKKDDKKI
jgi:hypothetical protein